ncbi:hypothetical protein TUMEXPCC7403_07970 [Tumidithrix helvetica PCC 7403]
MLMTIKTPLFEVADFWEAMLFSLSNQDHTHLLLTLVTLVDVANKLQT